MKTKSLQFIFAITGMFFMLFAGHGLFAQQLTLMPTNDAVVFSENPAQTAVAFNATNILANKTEGGEITSYVKFDISAFANRSVRGAEFSTRGAAKADTETVIRVRRAGVAFSRDTTNWSNRPSIGTEIGTKIYNTSSARRPYTINGNRLIDYINEELLKGSTEIAFAIQYKSGDVNGVNWIGGKGDGAWGPYLVIDALPATDGLSYFATADAVAFKENPERTGVDFHASNILVTRIDVNTEAVSYVKFELKGMAYKKISGAEFSTRGTAKPEKTITVQLRRTGTNFARATTNWANRPSMSGKIATKEYTTSSARVSYTEINNGIVNYINDELAKGNEMIAFGLQYDSGDLDGGNWIGGKGDGAWGPVLKIIPDNQNYAALSIADALVFSDKPDDTAAAFHASNLLVYNTDEGRAISYVKFDVSGFAGRVVKEANFSTRSSAKPDTEVTVKLTRAGDAFQRDTTKWTNRPTTSGELASVVYNSNSGRKIFTPNGNELINYINGKLAAGAKVISFAIEYKEGGGTDLIWIGGKGDGAWGPMLELKFDYGFSGYASDDATIFQHDAEATANSKHVSNIFVEKTDDKTTISFVKFNVADIAGMEVVDAKFSTRASMQAGKTMVVRLTQAGTNFSRATTNWANRPSYSGELATVELVQSSARLTYQNVGNALVNYINQHTLMGKPEVGFGLQYKSGDGDSFNWMGGKGDGAFGPMLELTLKRDLEGDTIFVLADAYVSQAEPETNFGTAADMGIRRSNDGTALETYLKFDISQAADAVIGQVKMTTYIAQHNSGNARENFFVDVYAVEDNTWEETGITWSNKPASVNPVLLAANVDWFNTGTAVEWTGDAMTHYMNTAIREGRTHVSFVIKGKDNTPGDRLWMAGREWRPMATSLIFDYTVPPPVQALPVVADAYVSQVEAERDANFGAAADQHLINDDDNQASKWIYFKYDISNAYSEAISASLNVYGSIHNETPADFEEFHFAIYPSTNVDWVEAEITWNNKPASTNQALLTGTIYRSGRWFILSTPAFTEYVNAAIKDNRSYVTLVAKGVDMTPGKRAWFSGKEWRASYISLNYEPQVAAPIFAPTAENHVKEVDVTLTTSTAGASIYYTINGAEPTDTNGTLYVAGTPIKLTTHSENKSFTIRAIAYAPDLKPSIITAKTYHVTPVSAPVFTPTPLVKYQRSVVVTISVVPEGSMIRYSDDGGAPNTIYEDPIILTKPTTIRAEAYNSDFTFTTQIVEAFYDVVITEPAPGEGPGGVGFANLSRENQPELSLWLRAHDIVDIADGAKVNEWPDVSGNENHAHNDETAVDTNIPNTGENWKEAPSFVANGLNNWPVLHFGNIAGTEGDNKLLVVNDADNLDGGAGLSIFMVVKRNQMYGDFAAIFQKRDIRNQPAQAAYVIEMDGGANPNKMQFVIARDIFLKSMDEFNAEDYYIINASLNSKQKLASFITNGVLKSSALYTKPIQNVNSPVIIGGFQPVNVAEIAMFNSDVNNAQTILVKNYLAAKYGLSLEDGNKYTSTDHIFDIIGVGRAKDIAGAESEFHYFSAGGALRLSTGGLAADGDFVITGHNGVAISDDNVSKAWTRVWNVETSGNGGNVTLGFDFAAAGLETTPSTDYKLWYKANASAANWTNKGITPSVSGMVVNFAVESIENGLYSIGILTPDSITVDARSPQLADNALKVYPNPAKDRVMVSLTNDFIGEVHLSILDVYGRLISFETIGKQYDDLNHELNLSGVRPGTYFIEVKDNSQRSVKRFIVQ